MPSGRQSTALMRQSCSLYACTYQPLQRRLPGQYLSHSPLPLSFWRPHWRNWPEVVEEAPQVRRQLDAIQSLRRHPAAEQAPDRDALPRNTLKARQPLPFRILALVHRPHVPLQVALQLELGLACKGTSSGPTRERGSQPCHTTPSPSWF